MPNVRLVRPDGSTLDMPAEQAGKFEVLGYRVQTPEEYQAQEAQTGQSNYWSTPGQKVATALEGVTSGLTLGGSDWLLDKAGATDFKERALENPGTRMISEIGGSLLPLIPGASALKALSPAGMLIRGGEAVAEGLAKRGVGKAVQLGVAGAIEGGGMGAGSVISDAAISGDPLTAEAITAGIGWGALWGGGGGVIAGKVLGRAEARAARVAAEEAQAVAAQDAWKGFRTAVTDLSENVDGALKAAGDLKGGISQALTNAKSVSKAIDAIPAMVEPGAFKAQQHLAKQAARAFDEVQLAAKEGNALRMEVALDTFKQHADELSQVTGAAIPELAPFSAQNAKSGLTAVKDMAALSASQKYLKAFPQSMEEFAKMTPAKAEKLIAAVDQAMGVKTFEGIKTGIQESINLLGERMGVTVDGTGGTQLRGLYEAARGAAREGAQEAIQAGRLPWTQSAMRRGAAYTAGSMASKLANTMGTGTIGQTVAYEGGKRLLFGLLGLKNAVVGKTAQIASEWAPRAAKYAKTAGSRVGALQVGLDGLEDKGSKDAAALMRARSEEIRMAASNVRDAVYKNVQGLASEHPELAAAIHAHAVERFTFIMNKLPRDPGNAFSRMNTLWKPSPVQIEEFARYYEVFQNPVKVMNDIIKTGRVLPQHAEGLREMNPSLFNELRFAMLNRLGDPALRSKLSYSEQVSLGILLQLPIHSTMTAKFIAPQQEMFLMKNQPLGISPRPGVDSGGGRPPGAAATPGATSAQKITEH